MRRAPAADQVAPPDTMQGEPPAAAAADDSAAPVTETPRRRSTIREPAGFAPDASPSPVPAVSSSSTEETAQPKRGWWGRRLMGGKD